MRSASVTVGGSRTSGITATANTALFGNLRPLGTAVPDSSPDHFTATDAYRTPGGTVTVQAGGSNAFTQTGHAAGQTGVISGDYSILSSTDSAIGTGGGGAFEGFTGVVGLTYVGFGTWSLSACANSPTPSCLPTYAGVNAGAQGSATQTTPMPSTGLATYTGGAVGYVLQPVAKNTNNAAEFWGTSVLKANFATNALSGAISNITAYSVGSGSSNQTSLGSINDITLAGTISGSAVTGTTSAGATAGTAFNIAGATGSLSGAFYGPGAAEVAGVFSLNGGTNSTTLVGSFGAKQQSSDFQASATLGGSLTSGITATLNTALFGSVQPANAGVVNLGVPDGFTGIATFQTPGGQVTAQAGGSAAFTQTGTAAGQVGHVIAGDLIITHSTNSAITTSGGGSFESFAAVVGLSYSGFGTWSLTPCSNSTNCLPAYAGVTAGAQPGVLQTSTMPNSGSATYTGGAVGYIVQTPGTGTNNAAQFWGNTSLTATFASGSNQITGSVSGITVWNVGNNGSSQTQITGTVNAVTMAASISGSSFTGTTSAGSTAGTAFNLTGATGSLTGAFYGPAANEMAGVFTLANTNVKLIGSFGAKTAVAPSDRRLKQDITPAGTLPNGLKLFSWRYLGGTHRFTGVMAQDLLADARFAPAVLRDADGLMRVDYAQLGFAPANLPAMRAEGEAALALYGARYGARYRAAQP